MTRTLLLSLLLAACTTQPEPCLEWESGIVEHEDGSVTSSITICGE